MKKTTTVPKRQKIAIYIKPPNKKMGKTIMPQVFWFCYQGPKTNLSIRQLRDMAEKRKLPPVDRTIKPYLVMPKKKHG